jgi:CubicO group peptidase (beta-lactamase class C family)
MIFLTGTPVQRAQGHRTMIKFPRRDVLKPAAGAWALPALALRPAFGQLAPNPAQVREPSPAERAAMARHARSFMEKYDVPALSFAVGYAGEIVHEEAFGVADRERNEAVTPAYLFRIASLTKMITSAAIFTLVEQNRLKLSDKVIGPGAILGTDYGQPPYSARIAEITVEQLLTHTSGGWTNDGRDPMFTHPAMNHAELITWTLANRPLDHPPGQHFAYSNFGYCILGRVIEKLTSQPYPDFVRAEVLSRCGINDMVIAANRLEKRRSDEVKYYGQGEIPMRRTSPGGIPMAAASRARAMQFLMHIDGYSKPANILKPHTVQVMTTPSSANANTPTACLSPITAIGGMTAASPARPRLPCARMAASAGPPSPTPVATIPRSATTSIR